MLRLSAAMAILLTAAAQAAPPAYVVSRTVPLGAPDRWDYLSFDAATDHVLVAHSVQTDVVDAGSGRIVGRLAGLDGAHGQVVAPGSGEIFADSGHSGKLTAFDPRTMQAEAVIPAGTDADAVVYEPVHRRVVVLDGDGETATLIDADRKTVAGTVKLGGSPEFAAADGQGNVFVNIASTGEIAKLDVGTGQVVARFAVAGCDEPHGLAMDMSSRRLFTSCVNQKLMVVDADSGKVLQTLPIGRGTDAAAFDAVRHLVFSSNGEGTLSVFHEAADGTVTSLGDVKTAKGARTMAIDPRTGRVFLVTADVSAKQPGARPKFSFVPGTVKLLILDPA